MDNIWELHKNCAEKNKDLDGKHEKAHRTETEKKVMISEEMFVTECNEKADELAKDGAVVDGGAIAVAMALTIKRLRK